MDRVTLVPLKPSLRLFLLGGFRVEVAGRTIPDAAWTRRPARQLVKLLAVQPAHTLHREQILDLFWPESDPAGAGGAFRKALHAARHALEPGLASRAASSYISLIDNRVTLDDTQVWIDADEFEQQARTALTAATVEALEGALGLYRGELLPEDRYEDWATDRREHLGDLSMGLMLSLATACEAQGDMARAREWLQQVLTADPTREDVHRRLMRLLARMGNRQRAIRQYQTCRTVLHEELDVEPEPATEALYQEILANRILPSNLSTSVVDSGASAVLALPPAIARLPATPLIARSQVLELVWNDLDMAATGTGNVLLMGGEAGVGKTRLAAELAREAQRRNAAVLWGGCYAEDALVAYGPFVEALQNHLQHRSPDEREKLADAYPELCELLPALRRRDHTPAAPSSAPAANGSTTHLFAALARLLDELAGTRFLVLVLDDVYLADSAGLHLFHHLARLAPEHPWLIVGTYRQEDIEGDGAFAHLRTTLTRTNLCRRVDLGRLNRADSDELVRILVRVPNLELLCDQIYALALGNPFFTLHLVWAMAEGAETMAGDGQESVVPGQVQELVAARLRRLSPDTRRILTLAAVAGMQTSFAVLRRAALLAFPSSMDEEALLDALDGALAARLLEEHGEACAFSHPLVRATLYAGCSLPRRIHFHEVIARAIEQERPDDVESLAFHYGAGNRPKEAIVYLDRAGDRARELYANEVAESYYCEVIQRLVGVQSSEFNVQRVGSGAFAGDTGSASYHAQVEAALDAAGQCIGCPVEVVSSVARACEKLGIVRMAMARYDEALQALERAAALYRAGGCTETEAHVMARIGEAHTSRGTVREGIARLGPVLERGRARGEPPPAILGRVDLAVSLAALYGNSGRYADALATAEQALVLATELDSPDASAPAARRLRALAALRRGVALQFMGRIAEAYQAETEALPLVEATGDIELLARALTNLAHTNQHRGEMARSREGYVRALELRERTDNPARIAFTAVHLGHALGYAGEWLKATGYLERGTALMRSAGASWYAAYPPLYFGQLWLMQGEWDGAARLLEEAIALAEPYSDLQALDLGHVALARLEVRRGRAGTAVKRLEELVARHPAEEAARLLWVLAEAEMALGHAARANELAAASVAHLHQVGSRLALVEALPVQGTILAHNGCPQRAEETFAEAVAVARSMPYPYAEATALREWGTMPTRHGSPNTEVSTARQRLREALGIFRRLGAKKDADESERALRRP